jgi:hypothetical protein
MANVRKKKKKSIHSLETSDGVAVTQQDKHKAIYEHFLQHLGTNVPRTCALNFIERDGKKDSFVTMSCHSLKRR